MNGRLKNILIIVSNFPLNNICNVANAFVAMLLFAFNFIL